MSRTAQSLRHGLTLVEMTVVLLIIGLLVSLVLVAVQSVRESARKVACQNNLHQLGLAVQNFTQANRAFPSLFANRGTKGDAAFDQSVFLTLLPELELASLQDKKSATPDKEHMPPAVLRCPSANEYLGYRFSYGSNIRVRTELNGILRIYKGLRPDEVTDGLSNTALASERMSGEQTHKPIGMAALPLYLTDGGFATDCMELRTPEAYVPDIGLAWRGYQPRDLTYGHYAAPNNSHWDCQGSYVHQLISARSWHSGGVQVLYADGHVAWASSQIDLVTWRALGTVAGGEANPLSEQ